MSNQPSDHRKLRPSKPAARERAVAPAGLKHIADKYSIIFDTTSDGIWIHNLDGQILEVNDAYCRMSGYTRDELLKLRIPDIEAVEKPEDVARHIRRVAETGFDRFESKHLKKNGEVFDVEISASYWRATGQFLLFARDISRRKRGEAELAQHRDHLDEMVKQRTTLLERMNTRLEDEIAERKRMEREIESMARFPSENPYPVLRLSRDGTILYANPPAQALLGGQGSASGEAAPAFLRAMAREAFDRRAATRVDIELDEKWWSFVVTPVVDAGYANFYGRDITDRKRAEEALRESEEKFKLIATHMPDHILVQDKDLRYTWVLNPQLGLTLDDMIGKTDFEFLPKEDAANLTTIKRRVLETGNPEYVTAPLTPREGGTEYFEGSYVPTHDSEGQVSGLIGYFRNVTERVKTEEELRLQSTALQAAANGIVITDREGTIRWVNQAFERLTGYSAAEAIGNNLRVLKSGRHDEAFYRTLWTTILSGRVWQGEIVNKRKDGRFYTEEMTITPVLDAEGAVNHFIAIKQDITERKQAEEALRQSEESLVRANNLLDAVTAGTDVIIATQDADLRYTYFNTAYQEEMKRLTGKDMEIGMSMADLFADQPEQQEVAVGEWSRILAGESVNHRLEFGDPTRHRRVYNVLHTPLRDAEGRIVGAGEVAYDITSQVRAEEALRESEERFQALFESDTVGIVVSDLEGKVCESNRAFEKTTGYTAEELRNIRFSEFTHPDDLAIEEDLVAEILTGMRRSYQVEKRYIRKSGETVWVRLTGTALSDTEGKTVGGVCLVEDITERKHAEDALRESEERYRTLLESAADAILVHRNGDLLYANPAALALYGAARFEELASHNIMDLVPPEEAETAAERVRTLSAGRKVPSWVGSILRLDGRPVPMEVISSPVDYQGERAAQAIIRDITERKRAEDELARANERMQKLLGANVIGIAEFDATKIVSANRALLDMTGYSKRDVARGRIDWREITPLEYAERDNRAWREMMEHGECLPYEKEYITRDGKRIPILIAGVRLTEDPVTGVFLNLDITDWKLMERELLETTHYAEHLFESSLMGIARFVTREAVIVDANDAFLKIVGRSREELANGAVNMRLITPSEYAPLDNQAIEELAATGEAKPYEKEYVRKDGSRVPVLIGRKEIRESPLEWVTFVLDLTERKRAEADLERVRTEFLGEISHELKTPLTAIKGCASMALSSATPPDPVEARELFEVVDTQANRLTDLVGNLLDMTRIEGGRLSIEPEEVGLAKIIDEARVIFEHSRYPHSLQVDLPPKLPNVKADGRRIVQVLTNLYSNAAKFSSPQTPIVVSAEHRGSEVVVHVRDRGAGIPGDKMPLLFQKFVQIHTIGAKGTGLGLFICKGIVEAQGGRIWAESPGEGQGSTFSFALPAIAAKTRAAKGAKTGAGKAAPVARGRGQRRVVAIDDEPHILRYLEHCLRTANYEVAMTTDPFAAPALVKSQDPDIVLLDMRLPGTSGLRVLEEIRKFSSVPVAFITATANREDVERGRQFGGTTWLEKPFSREQLLGHVRATLAQHRRRKR